jgi:hypothetical protein
MRVFLGYFVWGLILAGPLAWLAWRLRLGSLLPRWTLPQRLRPLALPPQLGPIVLRGRRHGEDRRRR